MKASFSAGRSTAWRVRRPAAVMPRGRGPARPAAGARRPRTGEKGNLSLLNPGDPGAGLVLVDEAAHPARPALGQFPAVEHLEAIAEGVDERQPGGDAEAGGVVVVQPLDFPHQAADAAGVGHDQQLEGRSEEHTSELQSLMSRSYAVFCLQKKTKQTQ